MNRKKMIDTIFNSNENQAALAEGSCEHWLWGELQALSDDTLKAIVGGLADGMNPLRWIGEQPDPLPKKTTRATIKDVATGAAVVVKASRPVAADGVQGVATIRFGNALTLHLNDAGIRELRTLLFEIQ